MMTMQADVEELGAAAALYAFLSHLFLHEPTLEELRELASGEQGQRLREMGYDLLGETGGQPPEKQAEELAVEYCRLFIGPGPHLSPHEAILRGEQKHWGDSTVAVNAAYAQAGFRMAPEIHEMPDHVGVELAFVAMLCEQEARFLARGAAAKAASARSARRQFLIEHLGVWLPLMSRELAARGKLTFYKTAARLALEWVESEIGSLSA